MALLSRRTPPADAGGSPGFCLASPIASARWLAPSCEGFWSTQSWSRSINFDAKRRRIRRILSLYAVRLLTLQTTYLLAGPSLIRHNYRASFADQFTESLDQVL